MNKNTKIKRNKSFQFKKISFIYYIPFIILITIVPLIVYGKFIDLTGTLQGTFWTGAYKTLDFFCYYKSVWLMCLTAMLLFTYLCLLISKKINLKRLNNYYIPMSIYIILILISWVFAVDLYTANHGFVDSFQNTWVLLSYVVITFLVINYVNSERDMKIFLYSFIFLITVEGLIGVAQYFGHDFLQTDFMKGSMVPSSIKLAEPLEFKFSKYTIYGTLFNSNFVGSFAVLMLPMSIGFIFTVKNIRAKVLGIISVVLCIILWIGCKSRAGYVGLALSILVALVMVRKHIMRYWKVSVSILGLVLVLATVMNIASNGRVLREFGRLNIFSEISRIKKINEKEDKFILKDIQAVGNTIKVRSNYIDVDAKVNGDKIELYDMDGNKYEVKEEKSGYIYVNKEKAGNIRFKIKNKDIVEVKFCGWSSLTLLFYRMNTNLVCISNTGRVVNDIEIADCSNMLIGADKFASSRGYIWGRTIPLLKDYIIKGAGADNFTLVFPQTDYITKINNKTEVYQVTDKPHNMYLQIAIHTGVLSLIVFLVIVCMYIVNTIRVLWKSEFKLFEDKLSLVCLLSVVGYLGTGMFNDQVISVAPLFFIILGLGIAINYVIKKKVI